MASTALFPGEDQTDRDFFDKLVGDDEFGLSGSGSATGDMARALSNLSISDVGTSVENFEADDRHGDKKVPASEAQENDGLVLGESAPIPPFNTVAVDEDVQPSNPVRVAVEVGSPGSSTEKSSSSKGTSIKEVQWSSFSSGHGQLDLGGDGSYSDIFTGAAGGSGPQSVVGRDGENTVANPNASVASFATWDAQDLGVTNEQPTYLVSSEQVDAQAHGGYSEQVTGEDESQYWENAYPGWKYDTNSGQWFQVDGYVATTNATVDGYGSAVANYQEDPQGGAELVDNGFDHSERSEISYLRQTAQSVVETVSDNYTTGNLSSWNQVSLGNIQYPPNMVFDPQYPGWYYDKNTLQWYSLESYTQSLQTMPHMVQNQQTEDVSASLDGFFLDQNHTVDQLQTQALGGESSQGGDQGGYNNTYHQHNLWKPEQDNSNGTAFGFSGDQTVGRNFYSSQNPERNYVDKQTGLQTTEAVPNPLHGSIVGTHSFSAFVPTEGNYQFRNAGIEQTQQANISQNYYLNQNSISYAQQFPQSESASYSQFSYAPNMGRSLEGRPPHALVTFGFGGKLIVMKDSASFGTNLAYGSQDASKGEISVLNLAEVVMEHIDSATIGNHSCDYFHSLCRQSFPGPLVGGNASTKDLNKWIDEGITSCESSTMDLREGELLRLLLSLLKLSWQFYGKLRSPFGLDPLSQEADSPELAVTRLFASARKDGDHLREYGAFSHCMHNLPSEGQIRKTAVDVQSLLVSGRRKEALQCAREGQLWGPALVLAAQLGKEFYVDTVKQMAHRQFVSGSPLRTLCLLIAGQPADVFTKDSSNHLSGARNMPQQPGQVSSSGMLDDWEENLAIITANRTEGDELVITHLGDCLWKEKGEVTAAHACYLVAEAKFEPYSDKARLCLIGADHWKFPRTYASPQAIQRTELFEYSKVLGNSQFVLLPFQPYKLVYAYMLADVGKVSDSLKYCQAISKLLKSSGRDPEVETWKVLVSSLEERLRAHQQGGYSTNLGPAKLVGKLFTSIDRSLHRMIGAPPPSLPPIPPNTSHKFEYDNVSMASKVGNSQSTMAMSSLLPSASVETINGWTGDSRKTMHNRSISEPDFGRSPKQVNQSSDVTDMQGKMPVASSRFGLFGSQLFQKTVGWMSRSRQAKLGEQNKFYYDEKLKRWVEEGAEPPAEEAALPPPPTTASFQHCVPEYNANTTFSTENSSPNGMLETKASDPSEHSPCIPPMPPTQNQFSARGRMGVRSRYVDTFNKGGGMPATSFQSPSVPSVKPVGGARFFVPSPISSSEPTADSTESTQGASSPEDSSTSIMESSSPSPLLSSSFLMPRFPSMDNISSTRNKGMGTPSQNGNGSLSSRSRAASWSGSYSDAFSQKMTDLKAVGDGSVVPPSFAANNSPRKHQNSGLLHANGSSYGDDLHEVEL